MQRLACSRCAWMVFIGLSQAMQEDHTSQLRQSPASTVLAPAANTWSQDFNLLLKPQEASSEIWNSSQVWTAVAFHHPAGMVSNVGGGIVPWTASSHMNLRSLFAITLVAYPVSLVVIVIVMMLVLGMCLDVKPEVKERWMREQAKHSDLPASVELLCDELTDSSQVLYACWSAYCRALPCLFIFGVPITLVWINHYYPQEVLVVLSVITSFFMFMSGIYMVTYGFQGFKHLLEAEQNLQAQTASQFSRALEDAQSVAHWIILPQYKEDVEVISMTLHSIARNSMAKHIGVLLAMEQREAEAPVKAEELQRAFAGQIGEIQVCYHPVNLPNDPPGKASNSCFAFHWLLKYLDLDANFREGDCREPLARQQVEQVAGTSPVPHDRLGWQGRRPVVLTVADADTEFNPKYFEGLALKYMEASPEARDMHIWQSPIFHIKNYHSQPAPVKVGTIFTGINDLATLSDPSAMKFPYSTYSMSIKLARRVGGWDAEWIAEDWHMGIKCLLYTMGQCSVQPLLLPTCNYTPEDSTWFGTVRARWTQMKRHALGFSDFTYYFMVVPLLFCRLLNDPRRSSRSDFWNVLLYGTAAMFKLVNVHVLLGIGTAYGTLRAMLKLVMIGYMPESRHIELLIMVANEFGSRLWISGILCVVLMTAIFTAVYGVLKRNIDGPKETAFFSHWMKSILIMFFAGPFFFYSIGVCTWMAAVNILTSRSFKYDVALKPVLPKVTQGDDDSGSECSSTTVGSGYSHYNNRSTRSTLGSTGLRAGENPQENVPELVP
mmetsp:Transcript_82811/g.146321  ORF Transcript_82811/g.146321 Transcript_82811/m.146321 type:complete len:776 (+) Transcript_82811:81-2408(+)|eukprot:CAMPEP_0197656016 /NCGR_PEP_ID=MMETSP1338-20131121/39817_1 /TAXON_ID=43686 ORGANISM="Pelagodinium beii, Strain RCC1491" /NCGR_SAMPLE_ID=MMETSP1338 /ASSEMBLY_ACC=CAM_ASM_000754 /LENGTH=775 /DNA_ID=CAMNT_0043231799 /DNA_START=60 /DNA_END=2387 /DNA_ORIENTATION=-